VVGRQTRDRKVRIWDIKMQVYQWRQSEFKVGGRSAEGDVPLPTGNTPFHRGGIWEGQFFFVLWTQNGWRILVNSEVLNLKFVFIKSSNS